MTLKLTCVGFGLTKLGLVIRSEAINLFALDSHRMSCVGKI